MFICSEFLNIYIIINMWYSKSNKNINLFIIILLHILFTVLYLNLL